MTELNYYYCCSNCYLYANSGYLLAWIMEIDIVLIMAAFHS